MAFSSTILLLLSAILSLSILHPSTANENNIFITGDILRSNGQLTEPNGAVLVMQEDCNLVLYNKGAKGFQTGTSGLSSNCTLNLSEFGQLLIRKSCGEVLWASPRTGPKGEYAVILQPDGQLGFYGPLLWTMAGYGPSKDNNSETKPAVTTVPPRESVPPAANMLFSSDMLMGKMKLVSRDYTLEVADGCNLRFTKANVGVLWESGIRESRENCFAMLNFEGQIGVFDDDYMLLSYTVPAGEVRGIYVLVLKINGDVAIYGHRYWSTALST